MNIVRLVTVLWFACIGSFALHTASAESDSVRCGTFAGDQAAAQDYFDQNGQPEFLDGDGDGVACATLEDGDYTGGPSAGPSGPSAGPSGPSAGPSGPSAGPGDVTCGSFSNVQSAAQEYFEMAGHPSNLDLDGDGQACASPEDGDYTGKPSAGPGDITCGSFNNDQAAAQDYFEMAGHPYNLDLDGDGLACASPEDGDYTGGPSAGPEDTAETDESSVGTEEEAETAAVVPATETNDVVIDALPVTGSGLQLPMSPGNGLGLLLAMSLIAGAGALSGRRLPRG